MVFCFGIGCHASKRLDYTIMLLQVIDTGRMDVGRKAHSPLRTVS